MTSFVGTDRYELTISGLPSNSCEFQTNVLLDRIGMYQIGISKQYLFHMGFIQGKDEVGSGLVKQSEAN